ncbi:MAG: NAD-dependent epimerase/dehydratase family protein [Deltaproteobacteria bacterium]|nr:NAD-dependent epimerase/dehydratase family protein [Deltaproteobacteria bacterium]
MKALVTGATGFVGAAIIRELIKDGKEVKVMVRKSSNTSNIDGLDVEKAYGDIRDKESVKAALKGCDTFYQAAALYEFWGPTKKNFYDVNVEGTKSSLEAALEHGVGKVVYTSSIAGLGAHGRDFPATEEVPYNLGAGVPHYVTTKYLGQVEALKMARKGLPVVIVNPATVIGIRDIKPTPSGRIILDVLNKRTPGYMDGGTNYVDVEDVARGHILAAARGKVGELYILGNANMSLLDFYRLVGEVAGMPPPKLKFPYPAVLATSYLYLLTAGIMKKPPPVTPGMARITSRYMYFDSSKAVNELGLQLTPIRTTVEKAVNWFRENGYVK